MDFELEVVAVEPLAVRRSNAQIALMQRLRSWPILIAHATHKKPPRDLKISRLHLPCSDTHAKRPPRSGSVQVAFGERILGGEGGLPSRRGYVLERQLLEASAAKGLSSNCYLENFPRRPTCALSG
jgi:hypothetical protein